MNINLNFGPLTFRAYSTDKWTHFGAAWVTGRNQGLAYRETAIEGGFRSDHITEGVGRDNPADVFECPETGTPVFGKIVQGPTGVYTISAREVYTKTAINKAVRDGLRGAERLSQELQAV